jgi:23S rRNA (cytosine1962-C5)-methyltransferase
MIKIQISKTLERKIRKGYPWVFKYQIQNQILEEKDEKLAVIYDHNNRFLALGLWDVTSDLCFRVLNLGTRTKIDESFFLQRLKAANQIRANLEGRGSTGYRIINGENDGFPGLVADRYEETLVIKLYTVSWFPFLEELFEIFQNELQCKQVVLRMARNIEKKLGPGSAYKDGQVVLGCNDSNWVEFQENGLKFRANALEGQKTGFFLDQRDNRLKIKELTKGKSVLNVFSYSGGFSVYAFAGGCKSVCEVDSNRFALETSLKNLKLNFPEKVFSPKIFVQYEEDAFQVLARLKTEKKFFDVVILDPPSFARKKKHKGMALNSYINLARAGAWVTSEVLLAASCSAQVPDKEFFEAVNKGIASTGRKFEEIERTGHAEDHPAIFKEAKYLKGTYVRFS